MRRRGKDIGKFARITDLLSRDAPLPARCRDHALSGNWRGYRECHIEPDWILIYDNSKDGEVRLVATGAHADIFYRVRR
jgi:mRNA interferase YafQ